MFSFHEKTGLNYFLKNADKIHIMVKPVEQSPQADFNSPITSIMRGVQQDFARHARSCSYFLHTVQVRVLPYLSMRNNAPVEHCVAEALVV